MNAIELHSKVVEFAQKKNISISQLEREAGFPIGTIKAWKNAVPSGDKIVKVAEVFDISIDYLLARTSNPYSHEMDNLTEATKKVLLAAKKCNISNETANVIVTLIESITRELTL